MNKQNKKPQAATTCTEAILTLKTVEECKQVF